MNVSFPELIYQALTQKIKSLNKDISSNREISLVHAQDLEIQKGILEKLKDVESGKFFGYSSYSSDKKLIFRNTAKLICRYCAVTIRLRCLELGFDNYDRSIHDLGPTELLSKLQEFKLDLLVEQLERLKTSKEVKNHTAKIFGFKPHAFSLNQEIVSAIFRADPIIGAECEIMMLTIYSFIQKKASQYGYNSAVERSSIDSSDFFSVASIGYLNATIYWDPRYDISKIKSRLSKSNNKNVAHFPAFGWTFAMGQITLLIYSRRLVRFPNHIEEAINRIHRSIRIRKQELMSYNPNYTQHELDSIIALEMKDDVKTIQDIFAVFNSPNSALSSLPSEQRLLNLNQKFNDTEVELIDTIQDSNISLGAKLDESLLSKSIFDHLAILTPKERVIICLTFGLKITPLDWQNSFFKDTSGIAWKDLVIRTGRSSEGATLQTVGNLTNLTLERIRSIQAKALRKLRTNIYTKTNLYYFLGERDKPKSQKEGIIEELKLYKKQMQELDIIRFNKICNRQHSVPKNISDAVDLFDYLKFLKPMTIKEALQELISRLSFVIDGSKYFESQTIITFEKIWETMEDKTVASHYTDINSQANFKNLVYHFQQLVTHHLPHSNFNYKEREDLKSMYTYMIYNPVFLVNLL